MKKSKSPAEQITAARAVSPRKALALTAAVLAAATSLTRRARPGGGPGSRHYCHRMLRYRPDRNRTGKPG